MTTVDDSPSRQGTPRQAGFQAPRRGGPGARLPPLRLPRHVLAQRLRQVPAVRDVAVSRTGEVVAVRQARNEEPGAAPKAEDLRPGGRVRLFAGLPGRAVARLRRRPSERPAKPDGLHVPLQGRVRRADRRRRLLPLRVVRRRPALRLPAHRGVPGRPPLRLRHGPRGALPALRSDLHPPLRPPRDLPQQVPRRRGRCRHGRRPSAEAIALHHGDGAHRRGPPPDVAFGGADARTTTLAVCGFKFLFYDIPLSVLVFLAWSVGRASRASWGERLAPSTPSLRRDP